jgi:hypothetical protein
VCLLAEDGGLIGRSAMWHPDSLAGMLLSPPPTMRKKSALIREALELGRP